MKGPKLLGDIDSFKNKQQIGLFTFYIETQNPNSVINFNHIGRENKQKYPKDFRTIENNNFEVKKICQYRINSKPRRRLKTLQACTNSDYDFSIQDQLIDNHDQDSYFSGQFNQIKELFNFKRQKNKKILEELLIKNEVDNEIMHRFSHKKGIINPEKLIKSKKYSLNGFSKQPGPFKSGYLSNFAKKMSKSLQKQQKLSKNLSEQLISPKQKLSNEMRSINEQLDIEFKLQEQRFRPNLFPFYKKRFSSYLKESQSSQLHPSSNDRMIQKLKNSSKLLQTGQKSHHQMSVDNSKTFQESQDDQSATASRSREKLMHQFIASYMGNSLINKSSKSGVSENQIDINYAPHEKLSCLQRNDKPIYEQRSRNYSEIRTPNQLSFLYNFSTLEKIYRPRLNSINCLQQLNRKHQNCDNLEKKRGKSNQQLETKKNLLIIVKKVKDQYVSI